MEDRKPEIKEERKDQPISKEEADFNATLELFKTIFKNNEGATR